MPHLVVKTAQDLLTPVQLRHGCTQTVENRRKFAGDVAAANHQEAFGEGCEVKHLVRRHHQLASRDVWHAGVAASGDQDVFGAVLLAVCHFHRVGIDQLGAAEDDRHPRAAQQLTVNTVQTADFLLSVGFECFPIQNRRSALPAKTV